MRVRFPFASVAPTPHDELLEQAFFGPAVQPAFSSKAANSPAFVKPLTLWALRSLQAPHGRCIGIRLAGDLLKVGVMRHGSLVWLPAKHVLSEQQADAWARSGQFYRG